MMKKIMILVVIITCLVMISAMREGFAGPAAKIAKKMAPRDATGDLKKVMDEDRPSPGKTDTASGEISPIQILTQPRGRMIDKESEEPEKPVNLLENPQVRKLLKPSPDFVYNPRDLKDPMIVPWIRNALLVKEFLATLDKRIKERKLPEAKSLIKQIEELLPDITNIELRKNVEAQLAIYRQDLEKAEAGPGEITAMAPPQPIATPRIPIPGWIKSHVGGVIWQPRAQDRIVLIGDEILKEGQKIPKYPDAVVQKINPSSVVISYRGITEEIPVEKQE